jgi:hypothetical protein
MYMVQHALFAKPRETSIYYSFLILFYPKIIQVIHNFIRTILKKSQLLHYIILEGMS